jgi:hypothetical protein
MSSKQIWGFAAFLAACSSVAPVSEARRSPAGAKDSVKLGEFILETFGPSDEGCETMASAYASLAVYYVYDDIRAHPSDYVPHGDIRGVYYPKNPDADGLSPPGYRLKFLVKGRDFSKGNLFVAYYEGTQAGLPPVAAFKGTTDREDWVNNVLNRGAANVQDVIPAVVNSFSAVFDAKERNAREIRREFLEREFFVDGLVYTGHSLGGALAQNMAGLMARLGPRHTLRVRTFNSLLGGATLQALLKGLARVLPLNADKLSEVEFPKNVDPVNFVTADDPLQEVNKGLASLWRTRNWGPTYVLPSKETLNTLGQADGRGISGHMMSSVLADVHYSLHDDGALGEVSAKLDQLEANKKDFVLRYQRSRVVPPNREKTHASLNSDPQARRYVLGLENARRMVQTLKESKALRSACRY